MPAKTVTLSQKDQDTLRVALNRALEWHALMGASLPDVITVWIKELKERLV